jgi:hypothetical protein
MWQWSAKEGGNRRCRRPSGAVRLQHQRVTEGSHRRYPRPNSAPAYYSSGTPQAAVIGVTQSPTAPSELGRSSITPQMTITDVAQGTGLTVPSELDRSGITPQTTATDVAQDTGLTVPSEHYSSGPPQARANGVTQGPMVPSELDRSSRMLQTAAVDVAQGPAVMSELDRSSINAHRRRLPTFPRYKWCAVVRRTSGYWY